MIWPLWFRTVLVLIFCVFAAILLSIRDGGPATALARSFLDSTIRDGRSPLLSAGAWSALGAEPADGSYEINGVKITFATYPAPIGAAETLKRFHEAFDRAGFESKLVPIGGRITLVGVHPDTRVLLTVRPGTTSDGRSVVRLSQHDLSPLESTFRPEIPGVPVPGDASGRVLVRSLRGDPATTLNFTVDDSVEELRGYYEREMTLAGWRRLSPPIEPPGLRMATLFFERDEEECSVVIVSERDQPTMALVSVTPKRDAA